MLKKEMQDALNDQINEELASAYIYAAMVAYFEEINLKGMAHWMRIQVQEELIHAHRLFEYVLTRGGHISLKAISAPKINWKNPVDVWEATYKHECHITQCIEKLYAKAQSLKDPAAQSFLDWYLNEQVEEEANAQEILAQVQMVQNAPGGLFLLDRELANRPAPAAAGAGEASAT